MSELLDSHELSMNIGSDDNASFHNPEIEEEFDSSTKVKDKGAQQTRGKDQAKVLPQRIAYQATQNRYPKTQHINYCFIKYDNPELCNYLAVSGILNKTLKDGSGSQDIKKFEDI